MSESQQSSASGMMWIVGAVISLLVIFAIFAGFRIFDGGSDNPEAEALMTPRAGGLVVPTATPAQDVTQSEGETEEDGAEEGVEGSTDSAASVMQPGMQVLGMTPTGNRLHMRTDAGLDMPVMGAYEEGTLFVILEPSGDYDEYPVENDAMHWYRVRAEDGLVGWIEAESLLASE